ncbi:MAG TPA: ABC transporter ATP-binding protein [Myxococcaceae bacterium]|nr:ABC transporter ATP-binding protein [Myxococcaceae bacterium]
MPGFTHAQKSFSRPAHGAELIRFEDLHISFGPKHVFEGLSLTVMEGEILTVMGGSGMGKSVLLKTLIGLLSPDRGRVIFEGQDLSDFSESDFLPVRRRISMVFQGAALFDSLTVGENISYPIREHFPEMPEVDLQKRVAQKLALVNLPGIEAMKPSDLSGGMRKRVGLARAIAIDPEVILWDEPTTGLDPISSRMIDRLILSMKRKLDCTSIVVTHDIDSAFGVSDRIAMIAKKKIVQVGTVEEMRASKQPEVRSFFTARQGERERGAVP